MFKNSTLRAIFLLAVFGLCAFAAFAQTSGWEDKGEYKEQKLKMDSLTAISIGKGGNVYYTARANKTIYYWNMANGILMDSLVINDTDAHVIFSEDGRSVCWYLDMSSNESEKYRTTIYIYDLPTKKEICKYDASTEEESPGFIYGDTMDIPRKIKPEVDFGINLIDYNYKSNILYLSTHFTDTSTSIINGVRQNTKLLRGLYSINVVYPNLLAPYRIYPVSIYDYAIDPYDYIFLGRAGSAIKTTNLGDSSLITEEKILNNFFLANADYYNKDLYNRTPLLLESYINNNIYKDTTLIKSEEYGENTPFDRIWAKGERSYLLTRGSDFIDFSCDYENEVQLFYHSLPKGATNLLTNRVLSKFFGFNKVELYLLDSAKDAIPREIKLPFTADTMVLHPNEKQLLFANFSGNIYLYNIEPIIPDYELSGWQDKDQYFDQKLVHAKLQSIAFSTDSAIFYTLHNNEVVYYWNRKTGKLFDSLNIMDDDVRCSFSSDGKTLQYYERFKRIYNNLSLPIKLIDLKSKLPISSYDLKIPDDFDVALPQDTYEHFIWQRLNDVYFTILDYNSERKQLNAGFAYSLESTSSSIITVEVNRNTLFGGSAVFEVRPDTMIRVRRTTVDPTKSLIYAGNKAYQTLYRYQWESARTSNISKSSKISYDFILNKLDYLTDQGLDLKKGGYFRESSWSEHSGDKYTESGVIRPFTSLLHDSTNNRLFMKADSIYYIFDLATDKQIDSLALPTKNGFEIFNKDFSGVFYYQNNKIFSQSVEFKTLVDSVDCPFVPNSLSFVPNSEDLMATSDSGRIIIFKDFKFSKQLIPVWVDRGSYKEDAIRIPGLQSIAYAPDGKTFYTLHNNKTVYYWDLATGTIIDSLVIPENKVFCRFSKEGKSVIYNSEFEIGKSSVQSTVGIFDLPTKQRITRSLISMPGNVECDLLTYSSEIWLYPTNFYNINFTFLDYNSAANELYCGAAFGYRQYTTQDNSRSKTTYFGGAAQLNITPNTATRDYQYSLYPVHNVLRLYNNDYRTEFSLVGEDNVMTGYSEGDFYNKTKLIKKNRNTGDSLEIMNRFGIRSYYRTQQTGYEWSESGFNSSFTKLLRDEMNYRLYMKADSIYFILDLETDKLIDSIALPTKNGMEQFNKSFSKVIYYYNGKIYSQSVPYGYLIDSLDCPFVPNSISLVPNSEDVALTSDSGRIIIFKKFNSIPFRAVESTEIFLGPNPASDELFLAFENDLNGSIIEIYTATGLKVLEAPYSERIDISSLPAGVYFLRSGGKIGKFVKK